MPGKWASNCVKLVMCGFYSPETFSFNSVLSQLSAAVVIPRLVGLLWRLLSRTQCCEEIFRYPEWHEGVTYCNRVLGSTCHCYNWNGSLTIHGSYYDLNNIHFGSSSLHCQLCFDQRHDFSVTTWSGLSTLVLAIMKYENNFAKITCLALDI